MRALGVSTVSALIALTIACSPASAQAGAELEPGVHVDPGSPAAKQYALPLNQARRTGAPEGRGAGAAFGAGIHPPGSGGGKASQHGPTTGGKGSGGQGESAGGASRRGASRVAAGAPRGTSRPTAAVLNSASSNSYTGGDGSILALLGGGVAILILGLFGGMVLRRGHRPSTSA